MLSRHDEGTIIMKAVSKLIGIVPVIAVLLGVSPPAAGQVACTPGVAECPGVCPCPDAGFCVECPDGQCACADDQCPCAGPCGECPDRLGQCPDRAEKGKWGCVLTFGLITEHLVLLKNGKVFLVGQQFQFRLFDPERETETFPVSTLFITAPLHDIICSGHAALPDGRILFTGGPDSVLTTIFDPDKLVVINWPEVECQGCWEAQQESLAERFYPTCTALPDGTVLVTAGDGSGETSSRIPMIFDAAAPAGQRWRHLNGAEYCPGCPYDFDIRMYPFMFLLSDGDVLLAGSDNGNMDDAPSGSGTRELDTCLETWTDVAVGGADLILGGSAVMYAADKIMKAGGRPGPLASAYTIDMQAQTPVWTARDCMTNPRKEFYLVVLPDGKILAVGGRNGSGDVDEPELYDPGSDSWTVMAPMSKPRTYHSCALLLPNARVLISGGNDTPSGPQPTGEVFSPPYLFDTGGTAATRPSITSVTGAAGAGVIEYSETFTVDTPEAENVTAVSLIRPGAVTHGLDMEQRFMSLTIEGAQGTLLSVKAPLRPEEAPPGYYMLFILTGTTTKVPSIAEFVKLQQGTGRCVPSVPAPYPDLHLTDAGDGTRIRYLSVRTCTPYKTALRVTYVDLPPPFAGCNGRTRWVGQPTAISEVSSLRDETPPTFQGATLTSAPVGVQWGAGGATHVYDEDIVPDATYEIQAIHEDCDTSDESNYSPPLSITTSRWGDSVGNCAVTPCTPPNGVVDFIDIAAIVDKFKNEIWAISKTRADLFDNLPDRFVDFVDISSTVDAFRGDPYPLDGPTPPCPP